jgi:hypothetical protein
VPDPAPPGRTSPGPPSPEPPSPEPASLVAVLTGFARELRAAGLGVGSGDVATYCAASARLNPADLIDLYWAGRTTLVTGRDQIPVYDRVFARYFLDEGDAPPEPPARVPRSAARSLAVVQVPETEPGEQDTREPETPLGLAAADTEVLRTKSFTACTPEELAALRRIMTRIRLTPPRRRTRRTAPARRGGQPDLRRTARETLRTHGEPAELFRRRRRQRLRPLILILDVSGSMSDYSRTLLQFAHSATRAGVRTEVFCFGTRLTRITGPLRRRRPDDAMRLAARAVLDWEGGTRIGDSLDAFVRGWGRRGACRGGIVVICSDGLDRGDPQLLATAMGRLSRLCHRLVWMNPHRGHGREYRPGTVGMTIAAPHVDLLLPGNDLRSLEELAALLPGLG